LQSPFILCSLHHTKDYLVTVVMAFVSQSQLFLFSLMLQKSEKRTALFINDGRILFKIDALEIVSKQLFWYALSCASASASLSLVMELIYVLFYLETIDTKNCLFILGRAL